jgi:hypothetical protein
MNFVEPRSSTWKTTARSRFEVQARDLPQLVARVRERARARPRVRDGLADPAVEERAQDFFLALEVEVDRAVGHARDARHVRDLRVEVAAAGEDFGGGAQDGLALVGDRRPGRLAERTCGTHSGETPSSLVPVRTAE